ncbi:MAG: hypothetical protein ABL973_14660 [Micropepsaceae bacterium]
MNKGTAAAGFVALALAVGALGYLSANTILADAAAGPGCDVGAWSNWTPPRMRPHRAEAFSHGPNCANAAVTIIVRDPSGAPLWVDAMAASHLMPFQGVNSNRQMVAALRDWVSNPSTLKTSADFPVWPKGAQAPAAGEFPFYPEKDVDRDTYEKLRAARVPVFCYVQGMESMSCVVLQDGGMMKVGVQTFPG